MRARTPAAIAQCGWMLTIAALLSLYAAQSTAQPTSNSSVGTSKTPGSTGQHGLAGKTPGSTGQHGLAGKTPTSTGQNCGGALLGPGCTQSSGQANRAPRKPTYKSR